MKMSSIFERFSWSHRLLCVLLSVVLVVGLSPQMSWATESDDDATADVAEATQTVDPEDVAVAEEAQTVDDSAAELSVSAGATHEVSAKASKPKTIKVGSVAYRYEDKFGGAGGEYTVIEPLETYEVPSGASALSIDDAGCYSKERAAEMLHSVMSEHGETLEFNIWSNDPDYKALGSGIINDALAMDDNDPFGGDYLSFLYDGCSRIGYSYYDYGESYSNYEGIEAQYLYNITYHITYKTTSEQERELGERVDQILTDLNLEGKSAYEKSRLIYDYICTHVTYDYAHLKDESYRRQFTAYAAVFDGTAVCQGYASLFYLMGLKAGLSVRCISGIGNGGAHAWNIVQLDDGLYYNLDSTWDSSTTRRYQCFLKNEADFVDHSRGVGSGSGINYGSSEFYQRYQMAGDSYNVPKEGGFVGNSLSVNARVGVNFYADLSDDLVASGDTYMVFTKQNGETLRADFDSKATGEMSDGRTAYRFACDIPAKEMADDLHAELYSADGYLLKSTHYSAAQYCKERYMNSKKNEERRLVLAMMNYGAYSQIYFGHNVEKLANDGLYSGEKALTYLSESKLSQLSPRVTEYYDDNAGIRYYGSSLLLRSETVIRHYFVLDEGANIADYQFRSGWGESVLEAKKSGDYYYVDVENVPPTDFSSMPWVMVDKRYDDGGIGSVFSIDYGVQSYILNVLTSEAMVDNQPLQDVATALYWYGVRAEAYFA